MIKRKHSKKKEVIARYFIVIALSLFYLFVQSNFAQQNIPSNNLNAQLPTLFVVGDSTARNNTGGAQGWGDSLSSYFDTTKINVANRAYAGLSSRTFINQGRWDNVLKEVKPGDFVLIQFGHNDNSPVHSPRSRGSLPGTGEETQEFTAPNGQKELIHAYGWYLRKLIEDTKAKKATPIVLSLTVRNIWKDGKLERELGQFRQWAAETASAQGIAFVDVTNIIADQYEKMGQEKVREMFASDFVHTNPSGANLNAAAVVLGLKKLKTTSLIQYLSDKGKQVISK